MGEKELVLKRAKYSSYNVFGFLALYSIKGLLGFILSGERRWAAVATNMRLLMAQGYPANQFIRVWFTLGCLMVLTGVSLAIWRSNGVLKRNG